MIKHKRLPDLAYLRSQFEYRPRTGELIWRVSRQGVRKGRRVSSVTSHGYRQVGLDGGNWRTNRIIWKLVTGEDPGRAEIDHRDGDPSNERWHNLRKAKRWQQTANSRMNPRNTSGFRGVWLRPSGRWCAEINYNKRSVVLGTFDTKVQASRAYHRAAKMFHKGFVR